MEFLGSFTWFLLRDAPLVQLLVLLPLGFFLVVTGLAVIRRRAWAIRTLTVVAWLALLWLGVMSTWLVHLAWVVSSMQRELARYGESPIAEPWEMVSWAAWLLAQIAGVALTLLVLRREGRRGSTRAELSRRDEVSLPP